MEVVVELDEVDRGLCLHLVDDHSRPLPAVFFSVLNLFTHQAVHHLTRFPLCRDTVVYRGTERDTTITVYILLVKQKKTDTRDAADWFIGTLLENVHRNKILITYDVSVNVQRLIYLTEFQPSV